MDVIEKATKEVCETFNNNSLIIFRSTVPLGTTEKKLLKILKKSKKEFDLCFCPERTAQGTALVELRKMPQVIGGINNQSSMRAEKLFKLVTPNVNIVKNILTAELTKLIDNSQRDVLFAYANEIAEICNDFDISANEVLNAAALNYPRTKLLLPGPVGGPCLTKDSHLLLSNLKKERKNKSIISSARSINESLHLTCFNYLKRKYKIQFKTKKITLCFLGIAFKGNPITDDIRGSIVHEITNIFRENVDLKVIKAYDPNVKEIDFKNLNIKKIKSLEILFRDANVVIILNNNKEFKNLNIEKLSNKMGDWGIIYDFWGNFDNTNMNINKKIKYTSYGSHQL